MKDNSFHVIIAAIIDICNHRASSSEPNQRHSLRELLSVVWIVLSLCMLHCSILFTFVSIALPVVLMCVLCMSCVSVPVVANRV